MTEPRQVPHLTDAQLRADRDDDEAGREQMFWDRVDRLSDYTPAEHVAPFPRRDAA